MKFSHCFNTQIPLLYIACAIICKICSLSQAMMTSPNEWKILELDENSQQTNQQTFEKRVRGWNGKGHSWFLNQLNFVCILMKGNSSLLLVVISATLWLILKFHIKMCIYQINAKLTLELFDINWRNEVNSMKKKIE